jgi:hypothetical protein
VSIERASDEFGPSTTWAWRKVKIKPSTRRDTALRSNSAAAAEPDIHRREAFTVVIKYVGGPESSWLVRRGRRAWRAPGHMALEDLMNALGATRL